MTGMQFTDCENCRKMYLVGVDGKDIRDSKTSGGKIGNVPYMAIGNEEIEKAKKIPDKVPCKNCGNMCIVFTAKLEREKLPDEKIEDTVRKEIKRIGKENLIIWLRYQEPDGRFKFIPTKWRLSEFFRHPNDLINKIISFVNEFNKEGASGKSFLKPLEDLKEKYLLSDKDTMVKLIQMEDRYYKLKRFVYELIENG